jgi:methionyl-tRNA formyltransferase
MKLVFAGTPQFAAIALRAILGAGHPVGLVLTQPDRTAGRGMALRASPVKELALASGIAVLQPQSLKEVTAQERVQAIGADALVVAAYGLILPQAVLAMPRLGCINIHASLLPRWRGAAPIQRALLAGDSHTGISIMQMDVGLDTGPVLLSASLPISDDDSAASLHDKLAALGARLIVEALGKLPLPLLPQPESGVTYARKIDKAEAILDWRLPATQLARQVRAFTPSPGALARLEGNALKVWGAEAQSGKAVPGTVIAADSGGIVVACGDGALRITELQKAGGKRLSVAQFLPGTKIVAGAAFALPDA